MQLFNAFGLTAAAAIPVVILLYLLKQEFDEVPVSSTYLWQRAIVETEASKPWQKLRKNLLMILQIVALAVLAFAIARPFLVRSGVGHESVAILDVSLSMQATDAEGSRIDAAKKQIHDLIDDMMPGDRMTIIAAGHDASMLISRADDKGLLKKALDSVAVQHGSAALDDAIAIAASLKREIEGVDVLLFSDHILTGEVEGVQFVNLSRNGDNAAVQGLSYAEDPASNALTVLARLHAFGGERVVTVECEVDGAVVDVRDVTIPQDETANVYFKDIAAGARRIVVRLQNEDDLAADNTAYLSVQPRGSAKVLLVTERNLFLEKALSLRPDVEVHKSSAADALTLRGYDLYVYDGVVMREWPDDGAIWLIDPSPTVVFGCEVTDSDAPSSGAVTPTIGTLPEALFAFVDVSTLRLAKSVHFEPQPGAALTPIATHGGQAVMLAGDLPTASGVQRVLLSGFDFHDSNWPVSKDFPIFVQNVLQWMIPQAVDAGRGLISGDIVSITARATTRRVDVTSPDGETFALAPPFPVRAIGETDALGFYAVAQTDGEGAESVSEFAANAPVDSESDLRGASVDASDGRGAVKLSSKQEITYILIAAALAVMMLEWWVYRRGL